MGGFMTVQQVLTLTRYQLDDTSKPYKWSDAELIEYLNMSLDELCRKARVLRDNTTAAYCKLTLVTSTYNYALSNRVVEVIRAKVDGQTPFMTRGTSEEWDTGSPAWTSETGLPTKFCTDYATGYITVRPVPTVTYNGTFVYLQVYRLQAANLTETNLASTIEIKDEYCRGLVHGILWWAWLKPGQMTFSQFKSTLHKQLWMIHVSETNMAENKLKWQGLDNIAAPNEAFS
jgi:hypothetical protein